MHAHDSTGYNDTIKNRKMVTKLNGTQEPYNPEILHENLTSMCDGLDMKYIDINLIVGKVTNGIPSSKYQPS